MSALALLCMTGTTAWVNCSVPQIDVHRRSATSRRVGFLEQTVVAVVERVVDEDVDTTER